MGFVLDASITLAWCFADEATATSKALLDKLGTVAAHVPNIWPLEISNVLLAAKRRRRLSFAEIKEFLTLLEQLNINIDNKTAQYSFHEILMLANTEGLTTYDAAYLELAMRLGLPLATKDKALIKSAKRLGVKILTD